MTGMRSWICATSSFESVVMIANVRIHSPEAGSFQFSQMPAIPNGAPSFMAIAYGCFAFWPLIAFHSKKPSTGTMQRRLIGIAERRQVPHSLALGIDRLTATCRVFAPIRNEAPAQRVERHLAGLMIAADDEQFLAGRGVPPGRIIVHATVAHVHAIDDGIPKRSAALNDPPAHGSDIVTRQRACQRRHLDRKSRREYIQLER